LAGTYATNEILQDMKKIVGITGLPIRKEQYRKAM
jgi:hypothetical protein